MVGVARTITTQARAHACAARHLRRAAAIGAAIAGLAGTARAQFVLSGTLVPGPAATFSNWGTLAAPTSGIIKVDDQKAFATGGASGSNFARIWMALGTQQGGSSAVSSTNKIGYLYIRIDHTGVPEEPTNFNVQLNLGGAPEGRVDHLLTLRPIFSGPNMPSVGRVRVMIKRYALSASGDYPLLGAFTTSAFATTDSDNGGTINDGTAIGWEGVAEDGRNGFEVRIPISWLNGDPSRLVMADGSGANTTTTAFFTTGGSFGAVATVRDWLADAAGNNVIVRLNTTSGSSVTATGTNLSFGTQPAAANAYGTVAPLTVVVRNADNTTSTGATNPVTLAIASGPSGASLSGTTTMSAVNGTATFSDLRFATPGSYTIIASSPGLLSATSLSFVISATTAPAPTIASITPSDGQLSVAFTAPANDGGLTITTYQYQLDGGTWVTRASGTTASPLVITSLSNGTAYAVRIRAVNAQGSGAQSNTMSGTPDNPSPPANTVLPSLGGSAVVGGTLTAAAGTWAGSPVPAFSYQWLRCDAAGANCVLVIGATAASYTLAVNDTAAAMKVVVTGTNTNGTASATSAASSPVSSLPANVAAPAITGTTEVGTTLSVSAGTWTGSPPPGFTYQWRRCDTSGANCAEIAAVSSAAYTLVAGDVGAALRVIVTATNTAGSTAVTSDATATVTPQPSAPSNDAVPTITGTASVGQVLAAAPGSWSGYPTPTLSYQWQRCDASGASCAAVVGATTNSHTVTVADTGATFRIVVTASNAVSATNATSAQTSLVPGAPTSTAVPLVTGTAQAGETLSVTAGSWTGSPAPALSYQWQRCRATGADCVDITGATSASYVLTADETTFTIRVVETATTGAGSSTASSAPTSVVTPPPVTAEPPANSVAPTISGTPVVGHTLTANPGTWSGLPAPTLVYQWQRCDAAGASCAVVANAPNSSYTVTTADTGTTLRVAVTGTNAVTAATATSAATAIVPGAPTSTAAPTVAGTPQIGATLTATPGSWAGTPAPTSSFQWQRCDQAGDGCLDVTGATGTSYLVTSADSAATIRLVETGTNVGGSSSASSTLTTVVTPAPVLPKSVVSPAITGVPRVGETLAATSGSWTGYPAPTLSYQWQRCDAAGENCVDIADASAASYTLTTADRRSTIILRVTGANELGRATTAAVASQVVTPAPVSATISHIVIAPADSVPADGTRSALMRIELRDASGEPLDGRAADLKLTLDGVAVATAARETAPGVYELELRSSSVNVVTATVSVDSIALSDRPTVNFTKAMANVDIAMAASADNPMVGDTVVFTVTVANHGPDAATGVEVNYPLSPRVRYLAADAARGSYDVATGRWSIGGLALNDSVTLKVTAVIIK